MERCFMAFESWFFILSGSRPYLPKTTFSLPDGARFETIVAYSLLKMCVSVLMFLCYKVMKENLSTCALMQSLLYTELPAVSDPLVKLI